MDEWERVARYYKSKRDEARVAAEHAAVERDLLIEAALPLVDMADAAEGPDEEPVEVALGVLRQVSEAVRRGRPE